MNRRIKRDTRYFRVLQEFKAHLDEQLPCTVAGPVADEHGTHIISRDRIDFIGCDCATVHGQGRAYVRKAETVWEDRGCWREFYTFEAGIARCVGPDDTRGVASFDAYFNAADVVSSDEAALRRAVRALGQRPGRDPQLTNAQQIGPQGMCILTIVQWVMSCPNGG